MVLPAFQFTYCILIEWNNLLNNFLILGQDKQHLSLSQFTSITFKSYQNGFINLKAVLSLLIFQPIQYFRSLDSYFFFWFMLAIHYQYQPGVYQLIVLLLGCSQLSEAIIQRFSCFKGNIHYRLTLILAHSCPPQQLLLPSSIPSRTFSVFVCTVWHRFLSSPFPNTL